MLELGSMPPVIKLIKVEKAAKEATADSSACVPVTVVSVGAVISSKGVENTTAAIKDWRDSTLIAAGSCRASAIVAIA